MPEQDTPAEPEAMDVAAAIDAGIAEAEASAEAYATATAQGDAGIELDAMQRMGEMVMGDLIVVDTVPQHVPKQRIDHPQASGVGFDQAVKLMANMNVAARVPLMKPRQYLMANSGCDGLLLVTFDQDGAHWVPVTHVPVEYIMSQRWECNSVRLAN